MGGIMGDKRRFLRQVRNRKNKPWNNHHEPHQKELSQKMGNETQEASLKMR
jgi:hypothetical protein